MKYRITHKNIYQYESLVEQSLNTIRLKPRNNEIQRLLSYDLNITPASMTKDYVDIWLNNVSSFFIAEQHWELIIESTAVVSVQKAPYVFQVQYSEEMKDIFHSQMFKEHYLPYLSISSFTALTDAQLSEVKQQIGPQTDDNPVKLAIDIMAYLHEVMRYDPQATYVTTTAREAFDLKAGVCQDFTHIMLGILRHFGVPSRYISGYLHVGEGDSLIGDTATHAWVEIMIPGIGWVGLDPTNNVEVLDHHIIISVGRDYRDVSPVEGVYQGGAHTLDVIVDVQKLLHL